MEGVDFLPRVEGAVRHKNNNNSDIMDASGRNYLGSPRYNNTGMNV